MISVSVPMKVESLNKFVRGHWSNHQKYKTKWHWVLLAALRRKPEHPYQHINLTITSYRQVILDNDNFVGGCKAILDALVKLNVLFDDSPEWVTVQYKQIIDRANPRTVIDIEE